MAGRSSRNTNRTSWPPIRRMTRSSRKRKKRLVEKKNQNKRVNASKISAKKTFHAPSDHQLFRGRLPFGPGWPSYLYFVNSSSTLLEHPSYNLFYSCFCFYRELKVQNNLRSVEPSEPEPKHVTSPTAVMRIKILTSPTRS